MAGLVDVELVLLRQAMQKFLIGLLQRTSYLADDRRQLPTRDRHADDIADELADGRERGMTDPLEVGDQGGQSGSDQAAAFDSDGQRSLVKLLTTRAPSRMTAVLLNRQRHVVDVNLLDDSGLAPGRRFQVLAAAGTKIDPIIERPVVDGLGRERISFVFGVSGLTTDLALSLTFGRRRLGRLDDVGGGRLGRCRGILPRRRELLLERRDGGLDRSEPLILSIQLGLLGVQLGLQARTIWTRLPCLGFHGSLC